MQGSSTNDFSTASTFSEESNRATSTTPMVVIRTDQPDSDDRRLMVKGIGSTNECHHVHDKERVRSLHDCFRFL
ncbi:unnamed protein product [Anisakis simplex]|uniref:Uncharacterized protein n=1 Tax=Anisakis simplex TaxID=6269 RepID=A0A0M3JNK6_ANISI|nr:unnamed protein product [Anisakis simplex]